ncbi:hypothetical protein SCLCIDRAFT_1221274 [Scleroderma citrinum Foug A]|uniref:Uncharacterized protein n=1 Tax=Scleroderma citrinum Foug A TaxID=1036808 RepID=A0A0C2Z086_9AGAM|nr:hypothetical protein SCLCIDRAFT_1221274 [Scleroderma citrinum Foug A]
MSERIRRAGWSVPVVSPRFHTMSTDSAGLEQGRAVGDVEISEREWTTIRLPGVAKRPVTHHNTDGDVVTAISFKFIKPDH